MAIITVSKLNSLGEIKIQYQGEMIERLTDGIIIRAYWDHPLKNLGYVCFEPGDRFIEYYYTHRWFNIFDISNVSGERKGWYCNIAEPATIQDHTVSSRDLLLDLWVDRDYGMQVLDEDEFSSDPWLTPEDRIRALEALRELRLRVESRLPPFDAVPLPNFPAEGPWL